MPGATGKQLDPESINAVKLDQGDGTSRAWGGVGDAANTSPRLLAGEENQTAKYDSQLRIQPDYKSTRITTTGSDQTVYAASCRIGALINETAAAATVILKDDTGTLMTVTVPANGVLDSIKGQRFETNLKVNTNAQPLVVQYREAKFVD